jgi:multiple sugar transport system permease protein
MQTAIGTRVRRRTKRLFHRQNMGYLFVAPAILFLLAFMVYPLLQAVRMSFTEVSKTGEIGNWIGFSNWILLFHDEDFISAIVRSLRFAATGTLICLVFGAILALLLDMKWLPAGVRNTLRGLSVLPWMYATSVAALMWGLLMHRDGLINAILTGANIVKRPIMFVGNPDIALTSLAIVFSWRCIPFVMVMVLAALKAIPNELYEAAYTDGASKWQAYWRITVPLIMPLLLTLAILSLVWGVGQFDLIRIITGGGPMQTTEVVSYYIYRVGFLTVDWSYGSTIGIAVFLVNLLFAIAYMLVSRKARPWE